MKKILSVNIDTVTLNIVSSLLTEHTSDFEILTAESLKESANIVKKLKTDIILIDLTNPNLEDLEFLRAIAKEAPKTPLLVLTAFETGEIESVIKSIGSVRYFEKPVDFKHLADKIFEDLEGGVGGEIHGISLASFLQMSEMEKTSCTLKVKTGDKEGRLYLIKGGLIAARTGEETGEKAVFEILTWDSPVIEIEDADPQATKEITAPLMTLLMEGLKQKDEKATSDKKKGQTGAKAPKPAKISISSGAERIQGFAARTETTAEAAQMPDELAAQASPEASEKISDAGALLKRQQLIANGIKAGVAVVVLIVLTVAWFFMINPWLTARNYDQMMANVEKTDPLKKKIAILDNYLKSNENSEYALQVRSKKADLKNDLKIQTFENTIARVSDLPIDEDYAAKARAIYKEFLQAYPQSQYAEEIKAKIDRIPEIIADAAYRKLKDIPAHKFTQRLTAYDEYLAGHPDGANTPRVKAMRQQLGQDLFHHLEKQQKTCQEKKNWEKCLQLARYFLQNFPAHELAPEVQDRQTAMRDRAEWHQATQDLDPKDKYSEKAEDIYRRLLANNPDTVVKDEIQARLAEIERRRQAARKWERLLAFVKNPQNDVFKRAETIDNYIRNNPEAPYLGEARNIQAWLTSEKAEAQKRLQQQRELARRKQQRQALIRAKKKEARQQLQAVNDRYAEKAAETITDNRTGLTWCMLDSSVMSTQCIDYEAAQNYVRNLSTGGYNDWRLPEPNELLVIFNNDPAFPAVENTQWYWTSEVFSAAWQKKVNTVKKTASGTWRKSEMTLDKCGAVRAVRP